MYTSVKKLPKKLRPKTKLSILAVRETRPDQMWVQVTNTINQRTEDRHWFTVTPDTLITSTRTHGENHAMMEAETDRLQKRALSTCSLIVSAHCCHPLEQRFSTLFISWHMDTNSVAHYNFCWSDKKLRINFDSFTPDGYCCVGCCWGFFIWQPKGKEGSAPRLNSEAVNVLNILAAHQRACHSTPVENRSSRASEQ